MRAGDLARDVGGDIHLPLVLLGRIGVGEIDHQVLRQAGIARDDAAAMQYLIPNWRFDPKRPCMVR